jgi:hypothetical protein
MKNPIPEQYEGKQLDLNAGRDFSDEQAAKNFYLLVKRRLLRAFEWYDIAEIPAATFTLSDPHGAEILREMRVGDVIRIDIPGPGSPKGDGYDWVKVDKIDEDHEEHGDLFSITLRPTSNPTETDEEVAHFFTNLATSTLLVRRAGTHVEVEYHGRNELINDQSESITDQFRNAVVVFAAKMCFSFSQWKSLIEGMIKDDKNKLNS